MRSDRGEDDGDDRIGDGNRMGVLLLAVAAFAAAVFGALEQLGAFRTF